ncbi:MAG: MBOAT family protein [Saprospiraceae bacterium]|nr:MBOAT family protein [Saprospiraceae bacterium]
MLFNSLNFALFLPIVFILYWFVFQKNIRFQNLFLVIASYVFYGWWDWRFLSLIIFSSMIDYQVGLGLGKTEAPGRRKLLLYTSLLVNLGLLGIFKYYNFFVDSFIDMFGSFGITLQARSLNVILPVGISFYTFQTLSYSIDVYRKKLQPTKDIIAFFAFVSFFPQLVAGPIERATNLLPQFYRKREFEYDIAVDGLRQILWGLFKKIVIADNCARMVDSIFGNYTNLSGSTLLLGGIYFAFQIYGDFSGYSDIAIGTARLFGISLMRNFAYPYFSRDIAEFWRRWHISLTSWFRDYVYIPLGGSKGSLPIVIRNTFIIFLVSGFWHGANWTFLAWGALNAIYFIPLLILKQNRKNIEIAAKGRLLPDIKEIFQIIGTFLLVVMGWIFFRAESIGQAIDYISRMFSSSLFTIPTKIRYIPFVLFLVIIEWLQRDKQHALQLVMVKKKWLRWAVYYSVILIIMLFAGRQQEFIYFQF